MRKLPEIQQSGRSRDSSRIKSVTRLRCAKAKRRLSRPKRILIVRLYRRQRKCPLPLPHYRKQAVPHRSATLPLSSPPQTNYTFSQLRGQSNPSTRLISTSQIITLQARHFSECVVLNASSSRSKTAVKVVLTQHLEMSWQRIKIHKHGNLRWTVGRTSMLKTAIRASIWPFA